MQVKKLFEVQSMGCTYIELDRLGEYPGPTFGGWGLWVEFLIVFCVKYSSLSPINSNLNIEANCLQSFIY